MPAVRLDPVRELLESGVSLQVGTRDGRLVPDGVRAVGLRVVGPDELEVFVPAATGARCVANVRANGRVALVASRIPDHHTLQLKGSAILVGEAPDADRRLVDAYRLALAQSLAFVGLPARLSLRIAAWPCHLIRLRVETVYEQTPGPDAGDPLSSAGLESIA